MKLDKLRPAWNQFKLNNSLECMNEQAILALIETQPSPEANKGMRLVSNIVMFLILLLCFQGG